MGDLASAREKLHDHLERVWSQERSEVADSKMGLYHSQCVKRTSSLCTCDGIIATRSVVRYLIRWFATHARLQSPPRIDDRRNNDPSLACRSVGLLPLMHSANEPQ